MDIQEVPSSSAGSSSPLSRWKYDVFLSFQGETRHSFTDHLYKALRRYGIYTFRDDPKLERGTPIRPELLKAIHESRYYVVIFSRNYASSSWCLDELAEMVDCKKQKENEIIAVFYKVEPENVINQTGSYQEAFAEHEASKERKETVRWREALAEAGSVPSPWLVNDKPESEIIDGIVKKILCGLKPTFSYFADDPVGIESRFEKLEELIRIGLSEHVRVIGICGMGGIGKTTLAEVVYNLMSDAFQSRSFLYNVREVARNGNLVCLQRQLLSQILMEEVTDHLWDLRHGVSMLSHRLRNTRALIIIDDVDHENQLQYLAGKPDWFGEGSRIIITTRDKHLLKRYGVGEIYKPDPLDDEEALRLLSLRAFKMDCPPVEKIGLAEQVIKYANGLPLPLRVLGSFLKGRGEEEWEDAIKRLKEDPQPEILDSLRISFDTLLMTEKKIFLDIACFFNGKDKDYVKKILEGCGLYPAIGLAVLVERSFITMVDNKLCMHDLHQELGRKIIKVESEAPGQRSGLWEKEDICTVLRKQRGAETLEGIMLNYTSHKESGRASRDLELGVFAEERIQLDPKALSKLRKLRLLRLCNIQLPRGLEDLPDELRLLDWHGYPLKRLPAKFQMTKLVELSLCCSSIEKLWCGRKEVSSLRMINLSYSENLKRTPDLTGAPNLEELVLIGCKKLKELHPSVADLSKLTLLNLKMCIRLSSLPRSIQMESLEKFILSGCAKVKEFPEIVGRMGRLSELHLGGTAITELPLSVRQLTGCSVLGLLETDQE